MLFMQSGAIKLNLLSDIILSDANRPKMLNTSMLSARRFSAIHAESFY